LDTAEAHPRARQRLRSYPVRTLADQTPERALGCRCNGSIGPIVIEGKQEIDGTASARRAGDERATDEIRSTLCADRNAGLFECGKTVPLVPVYRTKPLAFPGPRCARTRVEFLARSQGSFPIDPECRELERYLRFESRLRMHLCTLLADSFVLFTPSGTSLDITSPTRGASSARRLDPLRSRSCPCFRNYRILNGKMAGGRDSNLCA